MDLGSIALWISVVALIVSAYAAVSARRSAAAAERSAGASEETAAVERGREREFWIGRFTQALPDGTVVVGLLADLPADLRGEWRELVASAAKRNPRTPPARFVQLLAEFEQMWVAAASKGRS